MADPGRCTTFSGVVTRARRRHPAVSRSNHSNSRTREPNAEPRTKKQEAGRVNAIRTEPESWAPPNSACRLRCCAASAEHSAGYGGAPGGRGKTARGDSGSPVGAAAKRPQDSGPRPKGRSRYQARGSQIGPLTLLHASRRKGTHHVLRPRPFEASTCIATPFQRGPGACRCSGLRFSW
jgi:hypothetical protein